MKKSKRKFQKQIPLGGQIRITDTTENFIGHMGKFDHSKNLITQKKKEKKLRYGKQKKEKGKYNF